MLPNSAFNPAHDRQKKSLRRLAQLAIQVQTGARELIGYELLLGDENVGYVHTGACSMVDSIQNLMRTEAAADGDNPLFSQDVRHDLRNQVAVVKGFSDLMRMDLPVNHTVHHMLERLTLRTAEFVEILDSIKITAEETGDDEEGLRMAS